MEDEELSPALLRPQVTVLTELNVLAAITGRQDVLLPMQQPSLHKALENFTNACCVPVYNLANPLWHCRGSFRCAEGLPTLSWAPAANEISPGTPGDHSGSSKWHESVSTFEESWAQLAREATKLRKACRDVANGRGIAGAMEQVSKKVIEEAMGEAIREALEGVIDVGEGVRGAVVAESQARVVSRMRQQAQEALGLLNRLVMACRKITGFYRELWPVAGEIRDTMKGDGEPPHDLRSALAAKVAEVERLWVASSLLARDLLVGALGNICKIFRDGDPSGSLAHEVAKRCERAAKDIPNLLQGQ